MPTIHRQTPTQTTVENSQSVLSRIAPVKPTNIGRLKFSVYGVPKVGKTRLACTFPKPLLIIGSEDGTASVVGTKGVDFVQLSRTSEFLEIVHGPLMAGKYATVVVDTATKLRDMRVAELLGMEVIQKTFALLSRDTWMQCATDMKAMLRPLLDLPRIRPINVIIIAQEQNFTDESGGSSDIIRPAIGSALGKSLCDFVNAECDYIGQCLIREQTEEHTSTGANGKKTKVMFKTGKKEYCLRVGPHEVFITGFRRPEGLGDLPDFVVNPTYPKLVELITGGKK